MYCHRVLPSPAFILISPCSNIAIQTEEMKVKKSIKEAAKKGQTDVAKILAKELVQSRKAVSKLYASKAHMNSVMMSMQQQLCEWVGGSHCCSLDIRSGMEFFTSSSV